MIKERQRSTDLLKVFLRITAVFLLLPPILATAAVESSDLPIVAPQHNALAAEAADCSSQLQTNGQTLNCTETDRMLVADAGTSAPIIQLAAGKRAQSTSSIGGSQGAPGERGSAGWIIVVLIALVGVVAIPRRGINQLSAETPSKSRSFVLRT